MVRVHNTHKACFPKQCAFSPSAGRLARTSLLKVVARCVHRASANAAALAGFKSGNQNKLTGTATFVHLLKCGCMLAAAAEQMFNDNL